MTKHISESLPSEITLKKHYGDFSIYPKAILKLAKTLDKKDQHIRELMKSTPRSTQFKEKDIKEYEQ